MRRRSLAVRLAAALAVTIPAIGAGGQLSGARAGHAAVTGGTITVAYSIDAATLDPAIAINPPDDGIAYGALFDGLYRIDVKNQLAPDLADGMPQYSADRNVLTIHLKHGVMF